MANQENSGRAHNMGPELSMTQFCKWVGWEFYVTMKEGVIVTCLKTNRKSLQVRGNLTLDSVRYVLSFFDDSVDGVLGDQSPAEAGMTNKNLLALTKTETYADMARAVRAIISSQESDEHGVIDYDFKGEATVVVSFAFFMSQEDFRGQVRATAERHVKFLRAEGFVETEEDGVYANVRVGGNETLETILTELAEDMKAAHQDDPKVDTRVSTSNGGDDVSDLTFLQVVSFDLNRLGNDLNKFTYAGGKTVSKRARGKISGLFPRGTYEAEEMGRLIIERIEQSGQTIVEGYESAEKLAKGLMATRHGQIKISGNQLTFQEVSD